MQDAIHIHVSCTDNADGKVVVNRMHMQDAIQKHVSCTYNADGKVVVNRMHMSVADTEFDIRERGSSSST